MREIPIGRGYTVLIDDEDYDQISQHKWYVYDHRKLKTVYARRMTLGAIKTKKHVSLHREIMGFPDCMVDHINGNGLDNRRCNLRLCNPGENSRNRGMIQRETASGFKGVWWRKADRKWEACIYYNSKKHKLGYFRDKIDAAKAYNEAALRLHGEFASINDLFDPGKLLTTEPKPQMGKPTGSKVRGRPRKNP